MLHPISLETFIEARDFLKFARHLPLPTYIRPASNEHQTTSEMTKRTHAIRDQEHKNVLTVILRKYDLLDDLDKVWELGVREVADIPWITLETRSHARVTP